MLSSPRTETDVSPHLPPWLQPWEPSGAGLLELQLTESPEALPCWEPSSKPGSQTEDWPCNQWLVLGERNRP